nr:hypothetical protein [uncultured bacterium]
MINYIFNFLTFFYFLLKSPPLLFIKQSDWIRLQRKSMREKEIFIFRPLLKNANLVNLELQVYERRKAST